MTWRKKDNNHMHMTACSVLIAEMHISATAAAAAAAAAIEASSLLCGLQFELGIDRSTKARGCVATTSCLCILVTQHNLMTTHMSKR